MSEEEKIILDKLKRIVSELNSALIEAGNLDLEVVIGEFRANTISNDMPNSLVTFSVKKVLRV